jgi:hypothetical protein
MSFWARLLKGAAPHIEQKVTQKLLESHAFKRVVHTVEKEGLKGVHAHVKNSKAGSFASAFVAELKKDMGFAKDPEKEKEKVKLLQKRQ